MVERFIQVTFTLVSSNSRSVVPDIYQVAADAKELKASIAMTHGS